MNTVGTNHPDQRHHPLSVGVARSAAAIAATLLAAPFAVTLMDDLPTTPTSQNHIKHV